ncbi:serine/threonine-protein kinase [Rathayibacter sp. YIM 133350]|uniref:serine/threonine-protein kinase n=1 Tax=Rathayibacter sp. YIM 133350 TaxID=3131992 RepID=UPI00307DAB7E
MSGGDQPGQALNAPLLLDRYQPLALIARGGSASVFSGRDESLGRAVAIKVFSGGTESHVSQYRHELRVLAALSHHGLVSILDAGVDLSTPEDPRPFLIMELVPGRTLRATLAEHALSLRQIGEIGYEVAEALEYVHARGIIHRDITPSNIMLVDYGVGQSRVRARLTDFGIAIHSERAVESAATVTGTAAYLSPEQVRGLPLSTASDIYSLGLVLLECFTRTIQYPGDPVASAMARLRRDPEIPDIVSGPWRSLIERMTAREPAERPSAVVVGKELRRALRSSGPHAIRSDLRRPRS